MLVAHVQSKMEPYVAYIQDVLCLCQKVDPNGTKVQNILQGIADNAFHLLIFINFAVDQHWHF